MPLSPLLEPFNLPPPKLSRESVSSNRDFDRIDEVGVGSLAKQEDVFGRRTGVVKVVKVAFLRSDEDVTARKAQEPIAVVTFSEVKSHSPLSVGPGPGGDAEAEGRSKGTNEVDEWVQIPDGFEKLRTDVTRVGGLAEVHVDVGDLVLLEKG